jgi:hypothetical protein
MFDVDLKLACQLESHPFLKDFPGYLADLLGFGGYVYLGTRFYVEPNVHPFPFGRDLWLDRDNLGQLINVECQALSDGISGHFGLLTTDLPNPDRFASRTPQLKPEEQAADDKEHYG